MQPEVLEFLTREIIKIDRDPWNAEPKVVRGLVTAPHAFLTPQDLEPLMDNPTGEPRPVGVTYRQRFVPPAEFPTRTEVDAFFEKGATLSFPGLQRSTESVALACEALSRKIGLPCFGSGYLTSQGQGFDYHWDMGTVAVIPVPFRNPLETKEWLLYRPVIETFDELSIPYSCRGFTAEERRRPPYKIIAIRPGDVLIVPRGWPHEARANEGATLQLSIGVLHTDIDLAEVDVYP